jgi:hypothetical protein
MALVYNKKVEAKIMAQEPEEGRKDMVFKNNHRAV